MSHAGAGSAIKNAAVAPVESSADAVWIAIRNGDKRMLELLASYGATWEIPIDEMPGLTYDEIVATGLKRSVEVLGHFGDVGAAALGCTPRNCNTRH